MNSNSLYLNSLSKWCTFVLSFFYFSILLTFYKLISWFVFNTFVCVCQRISFTIFLFYIDSAVFFCFLTFIVVLLWLLVPSLLEIAWQILLQLFFFFIYVYLLYKLWLCISKKRKKTCLYTNYLLKVLRNMFKSIRRKICNTNTQECQKIECVFVNYYICIFKCFMSMTKL